MPRAGLTPAIVVAEAAQVADRVGFDRLTLASVAKQLGVALPSLYKHVRGLDGLQQQLAIQAFGELRAALTAAVLGRAGRDALHACAAAYREYARRHPGRYAATLRAPDPADTAHQAAGQELTNVIFAILAAYGLSGPQLVDATRFLRSALHGFVALENGGGFRLPQDVDRSFDLLVDAADRAFTTWPES